MINSIETKNANIINAGIVIEDHGILTMYLDLDYGDGSRQSFGGFSLEGANLAEHIRGIFQALGVDKWADVKGPCRVMASNTCVEAIGHFIQDSWFFPRTGKCGKESDL